NLGNCGAKSTDASGARPAPGLTAKDGDELNPFCSPAIYGSKKQLPRYSSNTAQASAAGAKPTRTSGLRNTMVQPRYPNKETNRQKTTRSNFSVRNG